MVMSLHLDLGRCRPRNAIVRTRLSGEDPTPGAPGTPRRAGPRAQRECIVPDVPNRSPVRPAHRVTEAATSMQLRAGAGSVGPGSEPGPDMYALQRMVAPPPALNRPTRHADAGASPASGISMSGAVRTPRSASRAPGSDQAAGCGCGCSAEQGAPHAAPSPRPATGIGPEGLRSARSRGRSSGWCRCRSRAQRAAIWASNIRLPRASARCADSARRRRNSDPGRTTPPRISSG